MAARCARWAPSARYSGATRSFRTPGRRSSFVKAGAQPLGRRQAMVLLGAGSAAASNSGAAQAAPEEAATPAIGAPEYELDARGLKRLALRPQGYSTWRWRGHAINWVAAGTEGPPVLLIHGFGASSYHWRYQLPALGQRCRVYALDCLGFGWSDKPLVEYSSYSLWREQITGFIREVIGTEQPVVLVGNSLGGYNALSTAAYSPELVRGVVLLNAAGRFDDSALAAPEAESRDEEEESLWRVAVERVAGALKRGVVFASFVFAKQPLRIRQVLGQVYANQEPIDDDLVASIARPALHPNAAEVFYRIITGRGEVMNRLLSRLDAASMPLFLLWGARDPWCVPARADQIQRYYPAAERVDLAESGHCPHDDTPGETNAELLAWMGRRGWL